MRRIITTALITLLVAHLHLEANIAAERPSYRAVKVKANFPMKAREVNNFRQVVLSPNGADLPPEIWRPGSDSAIPITVVDTPYNTFFALDINDKGYVCGDARKIDFFGNINDAFIWNPFFTVLDDVPSGVVSPCVPPLFEGFTIALNNRSDVAGTVRADSCRLQACVWMAGSGKPVRVGILQDYRESRATAINNNGVMTFDATVNRDPSVAGNRAFVWNNGSKSELPAVDNNPLSGSWSLEINDKGWIVGRSIKQAQGGASDTRPTLWRNGAPTDLLGDTISVGSAFGIASAINNAGMVTISGGRGLLWYEDSLWTLNDLIVNVLYDDGTVVPNIQAPISINDMGDILTSEGALLVRQPSGVVVNSTGDAPDNNLGDGRCYTGGMNSVGDDECTLRAAIQHANATPGVDTIVFNIPASGTPQMFVNSPLPAITEEVVIDGRTQGSSQIVEVRETPGSFAPRGFAATDGLVVSAANCALYGLIIRGFSGNGLVLGSGGNATVLGCYFGVDRAGDSAHGNTGHGILLQNSSDNLIGGIATEDQNVIAHNGKAGIFVQSGAHNTFTRNRIYGNGSLGIDLAAAGVTPNDSLDLDTGPNDLLNFPVIDSVKISSGQLDVFVSHSGNPAAGPITLEVYRNSNCDSSGYGEGEELLGSAVVTPNAVTGKSAFQFIFGDTLQSSQALSATATDNLGNTSEFARCFQRKRVRFLNGNLSPVKNADIILFKIKNDPPTFTETLIDTMKTDSAGYILFDDIGLSTGDTLKAFQVLTTKPAVKHQSILGTQYRITVDNAKMDSLGRFSYHRLNDSATQTVTIDHSTVIFNLVVSIEWDASLSYLQGIAQSFRGMADYLYDVSDGQARIDTVLIYDNKEHWAEADITIYADNMIWPHVDRVRGIDRPVGLSSDPIEMPRKWFGGSTNTRNMTFLENPLQMAAPVVYRTLLHEMGHYAFGFYDEYVFLSGSRCAAHPIGAGAILPYGYMDYQYSIGGPFSSELSENSAYSSLACRNTKQWVKNANSCWGTFESNYEGAWGSQTFVAKITRPSERTLVAGLTYVPGPNDSANALDYDVGSHVVLPIAPTAPATQTIAVTILSVNPGLPVGKAHVRLRKPSQNRTIVQGQADPLGRMRVLGAETGDMILASGRVRRDSVSARGAINDDWFSGQATVGASGLSRFGNSFTTLAADSIDLTLNPVAGEYPLNIHLSSSPAGGTISISALNLFQATPSAELTTHSGVKSSFTLIPADTGYQASIGFPLEESGSVTLNAVDDSLRPFFTFLNYTFEEFAGAPPFEIKGPEGASEVTFDDLNAGLQSASILSSPYPLIRTGIDSDSRQAGNAHSVGLATISELIGDNSITIRYSDDDVSDGLQSYGEETSLRVFFWNDSSRIWELVGGAVDTVFNEVTALIKSPGIYAAFTTNQSGSCCDTPGDANNDGAVNIADVTFIVAWLFSGGPGPICFAEADGTADGKLNIQDVTLLVDWLFRGGADPVCGAQSQ